MGNMLLAEPWLSDRVMDAYYASHEIVSAPASNLFLRQPKEIWRTQNVSGTIELRFDLGTPSNYTYNFVSLLFSNASNTALITWSVSTASDFSTAIWTSSGLSFINPGQTDRDRVHHFYQIPSDQTSRYIRFQIDDASNTDGYFEAGRLYVSQAYQPTVNIQYGATFGFESPTAESSTPYGERITRAAEPIPKFNFTLQGWGDTVQAEFYDNVHEMMRRSGAYKDVVAIINPDNTTYSGAMLYYGTLQSQTQIALPFYQYYEAAFELKGLI